MSGTVTSVKGVIFDLDGTLYHMKWYMKPLMTVGLFPHFFRLPRYISVRDRFAGKDLGSGDALMQAIAQELARETPGATPQGMRGWITDHFYARFVAVMPLMRGSRKGLRETLSLLRNKGVMVAVLSDYARVEQRLAGLGIGADLFDLLASAESSGALKPTVRPFLEIARAWNLNPAHILVIGDREDTDGAAAENAGMQFLGISDRKQAGEYLSWAGIRARLGEIGSAPAAAAV
jgi:FMN phosphatase YigB (HAD superfamily)